MHRLLPGSILLCAVAMTAGATEVSTGFLLGPKFDQRAFYMRANATQAWRKTYSGSAYKTQAQGKLMNLRLAQALFHDEWMHEQPFDPDKNVDAVIAALDFYKAHGVLMIAASLQGGNAGYEKQVNGIERQNGFRYGREKGMYVSAFRPDGSLKPEWMERLERLLRAADARGMVVNLMYFYQGQDEQFASTDAIHAAARNATNWLIEKNFRNVIIDVANEWDLGGTRWDFDAYIPKHVVALIGEVQQCFRTKRAGYALPVSASSDGKMNYPESLMKAVDVVLIHGNNKAPAQKNVRVAELQGVARPVLMNEDDNGRESTVENLAKELQSADILFEKAAGWGYMPWVQAQRFPFRYMPGADGAVRNDMPVPERDLAYFHAVLDHVAGLVLSKPVHAKH